MTKWVTISLIENNKMIPSVRGFAGLALPFVLRALEEPPLGPGLVDDTGLSGLSPEAPDEGLLGLVLAHCQLEVEGFGVVDVGPRQGREAAVGDCCEVLSFLVAVVDCEFGDRWVRMGV